MHHPSRYGSGGGVTIGEWSFHGNAEELVILAMDVVPRKLGWKNDIRQRVVTPSATFGARREKGNACLNLSVMLALIDKNGKRSEYS